MKPSSSIPLHLRAPRSTLWLVVALVLLVLIALVQPQQLQVVVYKAALIACAAVLGYWLDRALFPYARPDGYLRRDWRHGTDEPVDEADFPVVTGCERIFAAAMLRRALIVAAAVIGMAMGL